MNEEHLALDGQERERGQDMRADRHGVSVFESIHTDHLRKLDPEMFDLLASGRGTEEVRSKLFDHLSRMEFGYHAPSWQIDALERVNALYCIQVLKNLVSARNEKVSGCSTLSEMMRIVQSQSLEAKDRALFLDFYHIMSACCGTAGWVDCDHTAKRVQLERLGEASATGASTLVTACPKCLVHLSCADRHHGEELDRRVRIEDLYVRAAKALVR